ncbi:MAG: Spy/CpxP family protein refolding chaperone [Geothrix sp.]|uniref:Spy/CpxP family protein refolding chaperone n=1 Tax=Geothrix sp. TaxID=1962974 RepID=UPI00180E2C67|nr:Spy/CpxP family protein refolding chaperone [Geothrix sp.]NWJ40317.1 Spy/CpxP family protein refolding chaperone [Geothrix sp.]WIL21678.1 MAG: Spy/CpxP family protein refolding chaperone [Geothrix sp.]
MKPLLWSTVVLALAALPLAAQPETSRGQRPGRIAQALNLSDAQRTSIRSIREKHRPDLLLKRDAARQAQVSLRAALRNAATPEAQLRALYDTASAARFGMMLARRAVRQEVQAVLTPEQREKAAELRGMARERMRERAG